MERTIWIIAGESSGDAYGAMLADELRRLHPATTVKGMGGHAMAAAGIDIMVDSTELGVVGLVEVLRHIQVFRRVFNDLLSRAALERPDAIVLIDYPGFNLRLAKRLRLLGIRVVYYVSPQVWAWGKRRIPLISRVVDRMLVIFPFEPQVYEGTGLDVRFVGHPLVERLLRDGDPNAARDPATLLLLPGSRTAEVKRLFPIMYETAVALAERNNALHFVVAVPRQAIGDQVESQLRVLARTHGEIDLNVSVGRTREWLGRASAGLAASGTVTVEAAILGLPLVVVYRLHWLTYWMARLLVDLSHFTMVNLVAEDTVYQEFLQGDVRPDRLVTAVEEILPDGPRRQAVEQGMARAVSFLGGRTNASSQAAEAVFDLLDRGTRSEDRHPE